MRRRYREGERERGREWRCGQLMPGAVIVTEREKFEADSEKGTIKIKTNFNLTEISFILFNILW